MQGNQNQNRAHSDDRQCSICGSPDLLRHTPFDVSDFHVVHCRACRHEAIRPLPTPAQLSEFYRDYYVTRTSDADLRFLHQRSLCFFAHLRANIGLADRPLSDLNFLEVGFGNGASLFGAATVGFRAFGMDLDEAGVARAREKAAEYGVSVDCVAVDMRNLRRDIPFHVVKASQVIEHTLDPAEFLAEIRDRQPPGGHLIIECPNNDGAFWHTKNLLRKRYGRMKHFNSMKIGEHLSGFTRRSIAILLERTGYEVVRCEDYSLRHEFLQPENLLWYPPLLEGISRSLRDRHPYVFLKSLIGVFDSAASALAGRGTHLSVWAKKRQAQ